MWSLPTTKEQRSRVAQLFGYPDSNRMSLASLELDDVFLAFKLAHEINLTPNQTKVLHILTKTLRNEIRANPQIKMSECFLPFKETLYSLSVLNKAKQAAEVSDDTKSSKSRPATATTGEAAATASAVGVPPRSPEASSSSASSSQAQSNDSGAATAAAAVVASTLQPNSSPVVRGEETHTTASSAIASTLKQMNLTCEPFTSEQLVKIMDFMSNNLFQHFFLYRTVLDPDFKPQTGILTAKLKIETPPPCDGFSLDDATSLPDDDFTLDKAGSNSEGPVLPGFSLSGMLAQRGAGAITAAPTASAVASQPPMKQTTISSILKATTRPTSSSGTPQTTSAAQAVSGLAPKDVQALSQWVAGADVSARVQSRLNASSSADVPTETLVKQCVEDILQEGLGSLRISSPSENSTAEVAPSKQ